MKANKILVPLDGSEMAEAAIAPAREMAQAGSSLILIRAADARILPGADVIGAQIQVVREAEDYLAAVKAKLEKTGATGSRRMSGTGRRPPPSSRPPRSRKSI